MQPAGKLILIGGHEDKTGIFDAYNAGVPSARQDSFEPFAVLKHMINPDLEDPAITVVTTASGRMQEQAVEYGHAFEKIGYHPDKIRFLHMHSREETDTKDNLACIEETDAVFFTGGDQVKLSQRLANTRFMDTVIARFHEEKEFIVGGTSAGAAAVAKIMVYQDHGGHYSPDHTIKTEPGFDIGLDCWVDTHIDRFGRYTQRIESHVKSTPGSLGICLTENTAMVFQNGAFECVGSGDVILIDGKISEGEPLKHTLKAGDAFLLNSREYRKGAYAIKGRPDASGLKFGS